MSETAEKAFNTIFNEFCIRMKNCISMARLSGSTDTEIVDQILYILDGEHEKSDEKN